MFVERQRWSVPHYQRMEYDEFDTPAATYIVVVDAHDQALGTARLIPTTRPYMVESLWPDLVEGLLPHSDQIWEASRFGCDRALGASRRRRVIGLLIQACQEFGLANGISSYLGVMPNWVFRNVIAAHGCPVRPLGATLPLQGQDIGAAYIGVSSAILELVRQQTGTPKALHESPSAVGPIPSTLSPRLAEDAPSEAADGLPRSPEPEGLVEAE
jgi:acyl homoserine lactone synthase